MLNGGVREQNELSTAVRDTHEIRVMQIPTQVSLDWSRCPGGYEIVPPDGDPLEPVEVYEAKLQRDPQDASALAGLARCCLDSGDLARSEQIIGQLVRAGELKNPAVERALRIVRGVRWALLRQKAYPQRTYPPALPDVWTHELQARTKNITVTRPLDDNDGLYRQFADLEFEPESYRKFADRYGLLFAGYSPALWSYASFHACVRRALGLHVPSWVLE